MAIDPEELKRRRLERQQQRQNDRRKTIIKLIVAAVALLVCGILIFVFTRSGNTQPPEETTVPTQAEGTESTQPADPTTVIHMAFGGNVNVTKQVIDAGGNDLDFTDAFLDVAHLFADADIAAVNFEGTLCDAPYGDTKSAPVSLAEALSDAGIDLLQLANSYPIHFGMSGLPTTIDRVHSAGMEPLGVYTEAKEKGYTLRNVGGVKIAFVSFTKGMGTKMLSDCVNVLYKDYYSTYQELDEERITKVLTAVAKEKPDLTVAMLHWGSAYTDGITSKQEEIRDLFLQNGVDAIIGTHPHYLHEMEFNQEAGTFVAYSLGDLLGEGPEGGSEHSVVLNLEITKDNTTGETKITGFDYTPIYNVVEEGKPVRVVRIKEAMAAFENFYIDRVSQETYNAMATALERIESRLKGN